MYIAHFQRQWGNRNKKVEDFAPSARWVDSIDLCSVFRKLSFIIWKICPHILISACSVKYMYTLSSEYRSGH